MKIEVLWEQLQHRGLEHLVLHQGRLIEADGLAVGILESAPYRIQYRIVCDAAWNAQSLIARNLLAGKGFALTREGHEWFDEQHHTIEVLHGCLDVDIMVTPFTNTLPIKRLNLAAGQSQEISVVYVQVPELGISKFGQKYTCISRDKGGGIFKYESLKSGFTADLSIDEDGLVVDYPGIFKLAWKEKSG